jgi:subtilisin family serine protease
LIWIGLATAFGVGISGTFAAQSRQPNPGQAGRALRSAKQVEGELLVRFKLGTSNAERAVAHGWARAERLRSFSVVPNLERVRLPKGVSVDEAIGLYRAHADVLYAEPNYVVEAVQNAEATSNDPQFGALWGLHSTGQSGGIADVDIDAPEAWNITTGSSTVVVAVIDTGIDYTHPDLAANMFRNTADCNANGVDDDGNGYIDDCYGIDTANHDSNPMDDHGHGTHTAGTIGAVGNNSIGVVGVNWNVRLMPCKFLGADGSGSTAGAIACLEYMKTMKDRGVNIVATSNSWGGGGYSQALYDAIDTQRQRGILFVAAADNSAADNDSGEFYPANYALPNVISVAATTRTDSLAWFSNYGRRTVHLGAPGLDILSTTPNNTYRTSSGTSMATPHVSGVAALLKAKDPSRDWRAIKNLLLAGGNTIPSLENTITGKRLNANGALTCSGATVTTRLRPVNRFVAGSVGAPIPLAALNINCANPNGPVTVTVGPDGSTSTLLDDGTSDDQVADDGIYTGQFTPTLVGQTYTLTFPGDDVVTVGVAVSYNVAETAYNYRTITGANLELHDDKSQAITPPFPLRFGGTAYSTLYVGDNGVVGISGPVTQWHNVPLPHPLFPLMVAPFWDDLYPNGSQNVYWAVVGTAPNRELVVEWRDVPVFYCRSGGTLRFQTVFFEANSNLLFNYADTIVGGSCAAFDNGGQATVGVQVAPTGATQFGYNTGVLRDQMALLWTPQPTSPDPVLWATPNAMDFGSVEIGSAVDRTFTIQNTGGGTLTGNATTVAPFSIVSGGAFSLGSLATQQLVVRFRPTVAGPANRTVSVTSNASNTVPAAPVTGTALIPVSDYRLYWQHQTTGTIAAWNMHGAVFVDGPPVSPSQVTDTNWKIVGSRDFNSDGHLDLFWQHRITGLMTVWLMHGTEFFQTAPVTPNTLSDTNWAIRAIADMSGDGKPDLIWQHQTEGWLVVWIMNGTTYVEGRYLSPNRVADTNWRMTAAADFDGDGDNDLLWQHAQTGLMTAWLMNGTTFVGQGLISPNTVSDTNWKIKVVLDVDGNGTPDFIWHHQTTGSLVVWFMNGTTLLSTRSLTPPLVPDIGWQIAGPR